MKSAFPFIVTIMAVGLAILSIINFTGWITERPSYASEIVWVMALFTVIIYFYLLQWSSRKPEMFTQFYLLSIALKLLAFGAIIGVVIFFDRAGAIANAVLFLICYLLFTLIEVAFLFRKVSQNKA